MSIGECTFFQMKSVQIHIYLNNMYKRKYFAVNNLPFMDLILRH